MSGVRLEIAADQWWRGRLNGRLVIDVTRIEHLVDDDGTVTWAVLEGWRVQPGGTRTRDLVRAAAVHLAAG